MRSVAAANDAVPTKQRRLTQALQIAQQRRRQRLIVVETVRPGGEKRRGVEKRRRGGGVEGQPQGLGLPRIGSRGGRGGQQPDGEHPDHHRRGRCVCAWERICGRLNLTTK